MVSRNQGVSESVLIWVALETHRSCRVAEAVGVGSCLGSGESACMYACMFMQPYLQGRLQLRRSGHSGASRPHTMCGPHTVRLLEARGASIHLGQISVVALWSVRVMA